MAEHVDYLPRLEKISDLLFLNPNFNARNIPNFLYLFSNLIESKHYKCKKAHIYVNSIYIGSVYRTHTHTHTKDQKIHQSRDCYIPNNLYNAWYSNTCWIWVKTKPNKLMAQTLTWEILKSSRRRSWVKLTEWLVYPLLEWTGGSWGFSGINMAMVKMDLWRKISSVGKPVRKLYNVRRTI